MIDFGRYFLNYFDKRFPFFGFTLPLILLLYPLIPALVPLYLLPRYYGLHFLYLFLMLFNLRIQRDYAEKKHINSFNKGFMSLLVLASFSLMLFSIIFPYLEKGHFYTDVKFNWRSFFFFLSCSSLLILNSLWYFIGSKLIKSSLTSYIIASLRYPLIIIPPVFLNLHASQIKETISLFFFIFIHSLLFEVFKDKSSTTKVVRQLLCLIYGALMLSSALIANLNLLFIGVCLGLVLLVAIFEDKLDQRSIFGPSIFFVWAYFALSTV